MENIYKAFIKFQTEFKGMKPDASNPFFKSTYITLDGILETVRPLLAKNGLAVLQEATGDGEYIFVKTKLIHESGEMIETDLLKMKPQKNDPQGMGSCITYSKRYQLASLLGICESVDDDGNKASDPLITEQQCKLLYVKGKGKEEKVKEILKFYGFKDSKSITKEKFNLVLSDIEAIK